MFTSVVTVPAAPPATSGLLRSANTPSDGQRWQNGIAWRSEHCPSASWYDPCATAIEESVGDGGDAVHFYRPVAFRVEDECSTRSSNLGDTRVRRQALAVSSFMMARELATGALTQASPYSTPETGGDLTAFNHYLAEPGGTVLAGAYEPLYAIGLLEQAAREAMLGMDPFIHVPVSVVPLIDAALRREGQLLFTKTGATVVADAGYPGTGPEAAGTSEVQTVTITGGPTGGTWTLSYDGDTTDPLAFNAAAATIQGELNEFDSLGGVTVTGAAGGPYTVTFPAWMGNVAQMTASGAGLTGGAAPAVGVATTTPGTGGAPAAGTWLYATGPVQVRADEIQTNQITTVTQNTVTFTADRLFAAVFDPCTLHAIEVTVPEPAA